MKSNRLFYFGVFLVLITTFYSCEKKPTRVQLIPFDLKNNTTEACHMFFEDEDMNYTNQVGANSFITRDACAEFPGLGPEENPYNDDEVDEVKVSVGKDQKRLYNGWAKVKPTTKRVIATWNGDELNFEVIE